jgi:nucleoside-diphosphate-sugar epimerase
MKCKHILVTGGAGYVGAVLVPKLLANGYKVTVLDLYIYGEDVLQQSAKNPNLIEIKGDLRDREVVKKALTGVDTVIHLACISNDPSFELNPDLGKTINYDAFLLLVDEAIKSEIQYFIYASSSSVYGIKEEDDVTENLPLEPLTDYSKYKALCEDYLYENAGKMVYTTIRPSTVCGYSSRLRLDLTVNILTNHAINNGQIKVFGGEQKRPNIHIEDMTDLYVILLELPAEKTDRKIWNVGFENYKVKEIAQMIQKSLPGNVPIVTVPSDDNRSYHVSSQKIEKDIGFRAKHTVEEAVLDLKRKFEEGVIPDSMDDPRYFNIKMMQKLEMK